MAALSCSLAHLCLQLVALVISNELQLLTLLSPGTMISCLKARLTLSCLVILTPVRTKERAESEFS